MPLNARDWLYAASASSTLCESFASISNIHNSVKRRSMPVTESSVLSDIWTVSTLRRYNQSIIMATRSVNRKNLLNAAWRSSAVPHTTKPLFSFSPSFYRISFKTVLGSLMMTAAFYVSSPSFARRCRYYQVLYRFGLYCMQLCFGFVLVLSHT